MSVFFTGCKRDAKAGGKQNMTSIDRKQHGEKYIIYFILRSIEVNKNKVNIKRDLFAVHPEDKFL